MDEQFWFLCRQHFLQCPPGMLNKHYEKLIQCDMRLGVLSQQPEIVLDSPFFKPQASVCENSEESSEDGGNLRPHAAKGSHLRASEIEKNPITVQGVSKEAESPSSGTEKVLLSLIFPFEAQI